MIEAYLHGLETLAARGGDLAAVRSVASFFVSPRRHRRSTTAVGADRRCARAGAARAGRHRAGAPGLPDVPGPIRRAAVGDNWPPAAPPQPPLWASTSTKNPDYPDTRYVDSLIGPDTINTMAESTIAAFEDHGTVARTIDTGMGRGDHASCRTCAVGVDMDDVGRTLEDQGVAGFHQSFADLLITLRDKALPAGAAMIAPAAAQLYRWRDGRRGIKRS
mgnify:CR=1 FL=1